MHPSNGDNNPESDHEEGKPTSHLHNNGHSVATSTGIAEVNT